MIRQLVPLDAAITGDGREVPLAGVGLLVTRCDVADAAIRFDEGRAWLPLTLGRRFRTRFARLYVQAPTALAGGALELVIHEKPTEDVED